MNKSMQKVDKYFSQYIRLKHSFGNGNDRYCKCFTCRRVKPIKNIDTGHWIGRENKGTRYDENNCRPQGKYCNYYKGGRQHEFEKNLIKELGEDNVNLLRAKANQVNKMSAFEYELIAKEYKEKVKELQKELGCKIW